MAGVTPNGIHYPDGASKAKNLGPELERMAHDIDDVFTDTSESSVWYGLVEDIAEQIVPAEVDEYIEALSVITAYDATQVTQTTLSAIPISWTYKRINDTYSDTYGNTYEGPWVTDGRRQGDIPILSTGGKLDLSQIPDEVARKSDIPDAPDTSPTVDILPSSFVPVFGARLARARDTGAALAIAYAGSSTTARQNPGWTRRATSLIQQLWPVDEQSGMQVSESADFARRLEPGVHGYNAAQGATRSNTYLNATERAKLADLVPALLVHYIGSNDCTNQVDPAIFAQNITDQLDDLDSLLTLPCQQVLVWGYTKLSTAPLTTYQPADYRDAMQQIADSRADTVLIDMTESFEPVGVVPGGADPLNLVSTDGSHPSNAGYRYTADQIVAHLVNA